MSGIPDPDFFRPEIPDREIFSIPEFREILYTVILQILYTVILQILAPRFACSNLRCYAGQEMIII
jgi:hypothetical protein